MISESVQDVTGLTDRQRDRDRGERERKQRGRETETKRETKKDSPVFCAYVTVVTQGGTMTLWSAPDVTGPPSVH